MLSEEVLRHLAQRLAALSHLPSARIRGATAFAGHAFCGHCAQQLDFLTTKDRKSTYMCATEGCGRIVVDASQLRIALADFFARVAREDAFLARIHADFLLDRPDMSREQSDVAIVRAIEDMRARHTPMVVNALATGGWLRATAENGAVRLTVLHDSQDPKPTGTSRLNRGYGLDESE